MSDGLTLEQLQAMGAKPVADPGMTLEQLQAMGAKPVDSQPAAPTGPPAPKPSFLSEAATRAVNYAKSFANPVALGDVGKSFVDLGKTVLSANDFAGRAITQPVQTFGNGKVGAVLREGMRGVNSNIPLANLAVEHMGGPAEESLEDAAKAPGAQQFGGLVGTALMPAEESIAKAGLSKAGEVAGEIGTKIGQKAESGFAKRTNAEIFKNARPKDYDPASQVQRANPEEFKELIHSDAFQPVRKAAIAGKTELALSKADALVDKVSANRLDNYAKAAADGYQATPGEVVERMDKVAAFKQARGAGDEAASIRNAGDKLRDEFSTVKVDDIREGDTANDQALAKLKPYLPDRPTLTKSEFHDAAEALVKDNGGKGYGDVPNDIHQAIEALPFKYDPNASISLVQLRRAATTAQKATKSTLGSIAETEHFRIVKAVDDAINDGLDAHLNGAAATSAKARAAVERIRHDNKIMSMSISFRDGLEMRAKRENAVKGQSISDGAKKAGKLVGLAAAGVGAVMGHPAIAAGAGAAYLGYKAAVRGADLAAHTSYTGLPVAAQTAATSLGNAIPTAGALAAKSAQLSAPSSDDLLSQLVAKADSGDANAVQKLATLTRSPIVAARVQALRRNLKR